MKLTAFDNLLAAARAHFQASKEALEAEQAALRALPDIAEDLLPANYSFLRLVSIQEAEKQDPRRQSIGRRVKTRHDGKFTTKGLRLNNNQLTEIKGLKSFVETKFTKCAATNLGWIDLSCNQLTTIDPVLAEFVNLDILYLHGNKISNLKEVDKLSAMTHLHKLTLHGNEIEKDKGYRMTVLSAVPWLKNLDFSAVTICEQRTAATWRQMNNPEKKKKKYED